MKKLKLVVIGGGAAGTAAAHKLRQLGYDVIIIEQQNQLGGRILSKMSAGLPVEMGASFITTGLYPTTFALLKKMGLEHDLRLRSSQSAVVRRGKEHTSKSLLGNSWLSLGAKISLLRKSVMVLAERRQLDIRTLWLAKKFDDMSVQQAYTSRDEKELLEYLIQPILDGFFWWTDRTSNAMLMILMNSARKIGKSYTLAHGFQQIPQLLAQDSEVRLNSVVQAVTKQPNGTYTLTTATDSTRQSIAGIHGVVCATTATAVPKIFADLNQRQHTFFTGIAYSSTAVVARVYPGGENLKDCTVAYPRSENKFLAATSQHSAYNDNQQCSTVVKSYASGFIGTKLANAFDKTVVDTLTSNMPIASPHNSAVPLNTYVQKWPEALPEYNVGHFKQLHAFMQGNIEEENAKLVFAGDYIGGPFIEGAITSGLQAAERLHTQLVQQSPR